jgi:hypothetical protein
VFDKHDLPALSDDGAARRLEKDGYNEQPAAGTRPGLSIALDVVREPMLLLLIACGVLCLILGDLEVALMLLGIVFAIAGIALYQERKTERALEALRNLSSPRALVIRGGEPIIKESEARLPERKLVENICSQIEEINPRSAELGAVFQKCPSTRLYDQLTAFQTFSLDAEFRAAVGRLENGSYGRCTVCGDAIPRVELRAIPLLRYCGRCRRSVGLEAVARRVGSKSAYQE